jgi:hypothetical protein
MQELQTKEAPPHVENVKATLHELVDHLRRDAAIIEDPRASQLFAASAEVIAGLEHAFERLSDGARSSAG